MARIGTGGMGTVYEVDNTSVWRRYALKTLLSNEGNLGDITRRLVREARLTAALRHRNIVEVITAGTTRDDPPLPFYVMELLSGIPLRALMKSRAVPLDHVHQIGTELLDGLYQAHHPIGARDKPLVHCDLKPENIFLALDVSGKSTVNILYFGIAAAVGAQKQRGTFAGTPKYAAPEQFTVARRRRRPTCTPSRACSTRCSPEWARFRLRGRPWTTRAHTPPSSRARWATASRCRPRSSA